MTAATVSVVPRRRMAAGAADVALVAGGVAFLLLRPALANAGRVPIALGFAGLVAASVRRGPSPVPKAELVPPLLLGVAAGAVARLMVGPGVPVRAGAMAVALNTVAAVAEEAFFRRFLFGRLERWGTGAAIAGSALAFALIHVPLYGTAAFPVDLGAGLLLSWQRAATGRWSVPAATHALANLLVVIP
jgi:membrane protease YdiL (CAAX protease family)